VRSGIDRSEMFVTTKLWISDYGYERALRAFDASLRRLGLDYVDMCLLHWPVPSDFEATVTSYRAAEKLLADGRVRAIDVCNHSAKHLENLIDRTDMVPAVNQVEVHPFFIQREVRAAHACRGVVTQSWSPLGGVNRYAPADPNAVRARSSTLSSSSWRRSTARPRLRSCFVGTSIMGSRPSRSLCGRNESRRTSTSSTSY
jgi:diketogulonate reductase-like aldo/keto reductase